MNHNHPVSCFRGKMKSKYPMHRESSYFLKLHLCFTSIDRNTDIPLSLSVIRINESISTLIHKKYESLLLLFCIDFKACNFMATCFRNPQSKTACLPIYSLRIYKVILICTQSPRRGRRNIFKVFFALQKETYLLSHPPKHCGTAQRCGGAVT